MSGYHYQISEASRLLAVEAHVLRYWEEELGMVIPRNELGHRYYTEEHLRIFSQIKDMKERGYQLRAIRAILSEEEPVENPLPSTVADPGKNTVRMPGTSPKIIPVEVPPFMPEREVEIKQPEVNPYPDKETQEASAEVLEAGTDEEKEARQQRMEAFQMAMTHIVAQAMVYNNRALGKEIRTQIESGMLYDIQKHLLMAENRQEERYRKLDETLRAIQQNNRSRQEAAAAKRPGFLGRKRGRKRFRRI